MLLSSIKCAVAAHLACSLSVDLSLVTSEAARQAQAERQAYMASTEFRLESQDKPEC